MSGRRGGLGRNLSALLTPGAVSGVSMGLFTQTPRLVSLTALQPGRYQPRMAFDEETLAELTASIQQQGVLQPLLVREVSAGHYEIIAGERRFRACQRAGLTDVPVVVRQVDDETAMALALIENLQRDALNAMDEARALQRLIAEFGLTHQKIASLLSKSRTAVSNHVRLLNLTEEVQQLLESGALDMGHARCLLVLDAESQRRMAKLVVDKKWSVRETEAAVSRLQAPKNTSTASVLPAHLQTQVQTLSQKLKRKIHVKPGKGEKGTLVIYYDKANPIESLIEALSLSE